MKTLRGPDGGERPRDRAGNIHHVEMLEADRNSAGEFDHRNRVVAAVCGIGHTGAIVAGGGRRGGAGHRGRR